MLGCFLFTVCILDILAQEFCRFLLEIYTYVQSIQQRYLFLTKSGRQAFSTYDKELELIRLAIDEIVYLRQQGCLDQSDLS